MSHYSIKNIKKTHARFFSAAAKKILKELGFDRKKKMEEGNGAKKGMGTIGLPIVGMVMAEFAQVGLMILSKKAMSEGNMSSLIFVLYSNALASIVLLPLSLLFHRSNRPPLSFPIFCWFFLLALFGFLANFFGYTGIYLSSPTLGTSMLNLVPGITFLFAVIFRMEKLDWRSLKTFAKVTGTVVSIAGAFIMTFYEGPPLLGSASPLKSSNHILLQHSNWVAGAFLLAADCVMTSAWIIVQALILKRFPAELTVVFFYCFFVALLAAMACLIIETDHLAWSLKPNIRLLAVLYSGVFGSAFQVGVCTWCLHKTGPVFVTMFKPLGIVIAAAIGVICLGDALYLGSLVGAIVIVAGFYSVMWGKAKEQKVLGNDAESLESSSQRVPLLKDLAE